MTHHWPPRASHEHQRHLDQNLQLVGEDRGFAVLERFGAVPALKNESAPLLRIGDEGLELFDFPRSDERRKLSQLRDNAFERGRIVVGDGLRDGA